MSENKLMAQTDFLSEVNGVIQNISDEYFKTVENISTNKDSDSDVVTAEKEGIRIGLLYAMNVFSSYPKKPISPVDGVGS